ncbi:MAG TPA: glycosyltransferase family 2 protein [Patescibacteria group bacterium]|nr:glycosyltransferase family 2 protein [Patescibacteria group bacterium]
MNKISVVILTKNEEKNILDCIESVREFDEVILIDDYSSDRTIEVVKAIKGLNIKIFKRKLDGNFSEQRNFGLMKAKNEWVLFVDADERVSKRLLTEIINLNVESNSGFRIRRVDEIWGHKYRYGDVGNVNLIRLGRVNSGEWKGKVHEVWNINGEVDNLINSLDHFPHQTLGEFIREIDYYSTLRAKELFDKNTKVNLFDIVAYTKAKFIVNYVLKLGFLDGIYGFIHAMIMSLHSFLVRSKLYLLNNK